MSAMGRRCHGAAILALALVAYAGGASFVGARLDRRQLQVTRGSLDKAFELPPETGQHPVVSSAWSKAKKIGREI